MITTLLQYLSTIVRYFAMHKFIASVALAALAGGGYWAYASYVSSDGETRYVLGAVERGTIVASISASGQVAASDQVDVKTKAAGEVISVSGKAGQKVSQGQLLASLDATAARRAVVDAEIAVEEARLNLEHDTLQAPIDFKTLQQNVDRAKRDLEDAYEDGYTALSDAYTKLPDVITGADSVLYDYDINQSSQNISAYKNLFVNTVGDDSPTVNALAKGAEDDYKAARDAYAEASLEFRTLTRSSSPESIAGAMARSKNVAALLAKAVASEGNLIDMVIDILDRRDWTIDSDITAAQTSVRTYITSANSVLSSLSAADKSAETARDAVTDAEHALELASVGNPSGDNPFDLKLLQNTLRQKEAALLDARQALADTQVRAPFSGTLASMTLKRGDTVSSGATVGTMISDQKIAQPSLNEVDAALVAMGDKATLTFDAVEDLTLTGEVVEIDSIGTVSQNVVSYKIKIAFDSQDVRIKPGMTVNASIQIDTRQDVLVVPSSAVRTQNEASTVQVFDPELRDVGGSQGIMTDATPRQVPVEVGISDDTNVEIISGLSEGQQIVVRTMTGTAANSGAQTQGTGAARGGGFGGPPGGAVFIGR
jgi:HlyD family secretion protein